MSYLAGSIVLAVEAGAPNNAKGDGSTATPVKQARVRGATYPYVSAQAFRRWLRETMTAAGSLPSPVERAGKGKAQKATTTADPARYADDDLFGYMRAGAKDSDKSTTLRDSPFMVGTFMSVEPARPTQDFGVMARGVDDPVLHSHEFYTADLAAPFLLDLPRVGTFTLPSGGGKANYLSPEAAAQAAEAAASGASALTFRGQPAMRLPLEQRRDRAGLLLEALAELAGGAKKALHYGDRTPALVAAVPMAGGTNPLGMVIDGGPDNKGLRVRGDVLSQELDAWSGQWEAPVRMGWRPGFRDASRTAFEDGAAALLEAGQVRIDHPRTMLRTLADELRQGTHDAWFEDPQR
ncbi:type I-B CRISPR-associated protein Cas7/Cst2/DevR [Streptomonospora sediminis]